MRGEAFNFSRLGTFLERADNTARILDVKYHVILPSVDEVGGALDYYQWAALLRSVSSLETYRALYRDQIFRSRWRRLLILERRMPRSLAACIEQIRDALSRIDGHGDQAAKRLAPSCTRGSPTPISRRSSRPDCTSTSPRAWRTSESSGSGCSGRTWGRYEAARRSRHGVCVRSAGAAFHAVPQAHAARQRAAEVLEWKLEAPAAPTRTLDGYGNVLHVLTLDRPTQAIRIRAIGVVETRALPDEAPDPVPLSPLVFTRVSPLTRVDEPLAAFAEKHRRRAGSPSGMAEARVSDFEEGAVQARRHAVSSSAAGVAIGSGVCQDHAHVFIACCRYLGVPARYVSGYVYSPGHEEAHVASHAWAEAWAVDRWRSFDIANNRPAERTTSASPSAPIISTPARSAACAPAAAPRR